MSNFVYEVVDATDDEIYRPIGMFDDLEFVKEMIITSCPHQSISDDVDGSETIEVRKRKVNEWAGQGICVFSVDREEIYFEDLDESLWKTTITKDIESADALLSKLEKAK